MPGRLELMRLIGSWAFDICLRTSLAKLATNYPRREWSESGDRDMDLAPRGQRTGVSESIEAIRTMSLRHCVRLSA